MANEPDTKSEKKAAPAVKPFIFIINNGLGHRTLALRGAVNTTSKTLVDGPRVELKPGASIVERRLWDLWVKQNQNAEIDGVVYQGQAVTLLEERIPTTHNRLEGEGKPYLEVGPEVSDRNNPLADLSDKDAKRVIAETLDEPTLKKWLTVEKRAGISSLLATKLDDLHKAVASGTGGVRAMA